MLRRMAKAQDEHERHAAQHLVAAAGTAACAVSRRLHGRCFVAREPLSMFWCSLYEWSLLLVIVCRVVCRVGSICFTHEPKMPRSRLKFKAKQAIWSLPAETLPCAAAEKIQNLLRD